MLYIGSSLVLNNFKLIADYLQCIFSHSVNNLKSIKKHPAQTEKRIFNRGGKFYYSHFLKI